MTIPAGLLFSAHHELCECPVVEIVGDNANGICRTAQQAARHRIRDITQFFRRRQDALPGGVGNRDRRAFENLADLVWKLTPACAATSLSEAYTHRPPHHAGHP
nr:hypothetical protein [Fodinicola feengrottensis]